MPWIRRKRHVCIKQACECNEKKTEKNKKQDKGQLAKAATGRGQYMEIPSPSRGETVQDTPSQRAQLQLTNM